MTHPHPSFGYGLNRALDDSVITTHCLVQRDVITYPCRNYDGEFSLSKSVHLVHCAYYLGKWSWIVPQMRATVI